MQELVRELVARTGAGVMLRARAWACRTRRWVRASADPLVRIWVPRVEVTPAAIAGASPR